MPKLTNLRNKNIMEEKQTLSILIIEDDESMARLYKLLLSKLEHRTDVAFNIHIANDGAKGQELFKKHHPDIVILDIRLPEINGIDLLQEFRLANDTTYILVSSAYPSPEMFQRLIQLGANNFLLKPYANEVIVSALDQAIIYSEKMKRIDKYEKMFRRMFASVESIFSGIIITDVDGKIAYVNPAVERVTGYKSNEIIGRTPAIFKSGNHSDEFYKNLWQTVLSGEVFKGEIYNKKKDGSCYWQDTTILPYREYNDKITHFICHTADVSVQRQQALELKAIVKALPIAISIHEKDGTLVHLYPEILGPNYSHLSAVVESKNLFTILDEEQSSFIKAAFDSIDEDPGIEIIDDIYFDTMAGKRVFEIQIKRFNHSKFVIYLRDVTDTRFTALTRKLGENFTLLLEGSKKLRVADNG